MAWRKELIELLEKKFDVFSLPLALQRCSGLMHSAISCSVSTWFHATLLVATSPQTTSITLLPLTRATFVLLDVWSGITPEPNRKKLDPKGRASILLSYIDHGAGYHLWDLGKRCSVKYRDVVFAEDVFPYADYHAPTVAVPVPVEIEWS